MARAVEAREGSNMSAYILEIPTWNFASTKANCHRTGIALDSITTRDKARYHVSDKLNPISQLVVVTKSEATN
jgi:hypothetical protein